MHSARQTPSAGCGLALLLLAVVVGAGGSKVRELTTEDFSSAVGKSQHVLVQFYAPWCGHCQAISGDYEWLAENYADAKNTLIARVDADRYKTLANAHEISGYPTIKFFPKGASSASDVYNGDRAAHKMALRPSLFAAPLCWLPVTISTSSCRPSDSAVLGRALHPMCLHPTRRQDSGK
jgi:protein disulfide-isomerase-like protein